MSVNIMDLVKQAVGGQIMGQLGGLLGTDEKQTQSGINAALPAILGVLMKKASTPSGADEIFKQVEDQDDSILDNLGDLLGGGGQSGLLSGGLSIAKLLFGNKFDSIGNVLGKSSGMSGSVVTKLISFLVPVVISMLSRQKTSMGLNASSMASLLGDQKSHLGGSMTSEMGDMLGVGNMISGLTGAADSVVGAAKGAGAAVQGAGQAVGDAASGVASGARDAAEAGGSAIGKLLPLIGILALALLGWMFFRGGTSEEAPANGNTAVETIDQMEIELPPPATPAVNDFDSAAARAAAEAVSAANEVELKLDGNTVPAETP